MLPLWPNGALPNKLWPNQLLLSLSAEGYALVYRHGLTKRVLAKQHGTFEATTEFEPFSELSQVDIALKKLHLPADTALRITLSADYVRYLVLPVQPLAAGQAERLAYAKAVYREVYGPVAEGWRVQCDDTAPHQPTLTCAIDQTLLEALTALASAHQLRLHTVQPYLMTCYNQLSVQALSGYLVVVEPNRLLLMQHGARGYQQLKTAKWQGDWQHTLAQWLSREHVLGETTGRDVRVYAPMAKTVALNAVSDWHLKRVGTRAKHRANAINAPEYAMLEALA